MNAILTASAASAGGSWGAIKVVIQAGEQSVSKPITTLCYIEQDGKYLMLHRTKKKQDINGGKWIGVGGHLEEGESPEDCLVREVREETGLTITSYTFRGLITFISDRQETELMCLFTADGFEGEPGACNEGELAWIPKTEVLALPTWEGDAVFLEILLRDDPRFFTLRLAYEGDKLIDKKLQFYMADTGTEETV